MRHSNRAVVLLLLGAVQPPAWAQVCAMSAQPSGMLSMRVDNDVLEAGRQDEGYSNGFAVTWASPELSGDPDDACTPAVARGLSRFLTMFSPRRGDTRNVTVGLAQLMYTPTLKSGRDSESVDRPFAGVLLLSAGSNTRVGRQLRSTQVRVGVVGPSSYARQVQGFWHDLVGVNRYRGWDHQLRDEPVVQLQHERRVRTGPQGAVNRHWDSTFHWGLSIGNLATYGSAGGEWRLGIRLPDDFGTAPLRLGSENMSAAASQRGGGWSGHLFAALSGRAVLRDITLDGNTFRSSHRVDKQPIVADLAYGVAVHGDGWRIVLSRAHRTREFQDQGTLPAYGSLTIGRRF